MNSKTTSIIENNFDDATTFQIYSQRYFDAYLKINGRRCGMSFVDDKVYITDPHPSMKAPNIVSLVQFKEMTENLKTTIQNIQ